MMTTCRFNIKIEISGEIEEIEDAPDVGQPDKDGGEEEKKKERFVYP